MLDAAHTAGNSWRDFKERNWAVTGEAALEIDSDTTI